MRRVMINISEASFQAMKRAAKNDRRSLSGWLDMYVSHYLLHNIESSNPLTSGIVPEVAVESFKSATTVALPESTRSAEEEDAIIRKWQRK